MHFKNLRAMLAYRSTSAISVTTRWWSENWKRFRMPSGKHRVYSVSGRHNDGASETFFNFRVLPSRNGNCRSENRHRTTFFWSPLYPCYLNYKNCCINSITATVASCAMTKSEVTDQTPPIWDSVWSGTPHVVPRLSIMYFVQYWSLLNWQNLRLRCGSCKLIFWHYFIIFC